MAKQFILMISHKLYSSVIIIIGISLPLLFELNYNKLKFETFLYNWVVKGIVIYFTINIATNKKIP